VYKACGTRDIEKMGGLIKRMPWTAGFFLLGALAIAGMPPLNGFISEWLILQSLFGGAMASAGAFKIFFVFMMVCLAVTSGLAAACFVRAFGISFLAMPRSQRVQQSHEASLSMKVGMGILSFGIIIFGLGATFIWNNLLIVSGGVLGINNNTIVSSYGAIKVSGTLLNMPLVFGIFFLLLALGYIFTRLGRGPARVTRGLTWDCGYYALTPRTEYTATAFSKPFRIAFSFFFLPQRRVEKLRESYYHVRSFKYEIHTISLLKQYFYEPVVKVLFLFARRLKLFQMGSIHWYLGYILIIFMGVIVFVLFR
jgi:hydrogenase-4 component B